MRAQASVLAVLLVVVGGLAALHPAYRDLHRDWNLGVTLVTRTSERSKASKDLELPQ